MSNHKLLLKLKEFKRRKMDTRTLVLLGLLTGILLIMSYTPLGYLNIGPLAISLNMIPVAIAAIVLGPLEGAILGAVFGFTSFLQCFGIGGTSAMGVILAEISPFLAFVQRFVPRILAGMLTGFIYKGLTKCMGKTPASFISGACAALLNTVLFMGALVLLFRDTEYLQGLIAGRNVIVFICTFVGINAVVEVFAASLAVGPVCRALHKTRFLRRRQ